MSQQRSNPLPYLWDKGGSEATCWTATPRKKNQILNKNSWTRIKKEFSPRRVWLKSRATLRWVVICSVTRWRNQEWPNFWNVNLSRSFENSPIWSRWLKDTQTVLNKNRYINPEDERQNEITLTYNYQVQMENSEDIKVKSPGTTGRWSSGQRACLLLRRSDFESRWSLQFFCKICASKEWK